MEHVEIGEVASYNHELNEQEAEGFMMNRDRGETNYE